MIVAILFVTMFGFGPLAGMVTLGVRRPSASSASCSPKTSRTPTPPQLEAIRATGGSWLQLLNYGVQPQVMPRLIGLPLYRFDINFRESAVIGIVGAGGIGATLNTAFDRYEFETAAAILLVIIVIVMAGGVLLGPHPAAGAMTVAVSPNDARRGRAWRRRDAAKSSSRSGSDGSRARLSSCLRGGWSPSRTTWALRVDAPQQGADLLARMMPPRWSYLGQLWRPLWDTINIATLGTALAIVLAVPVAFLRRAQHHAERYARTAARAAH